MDSTTGKGGRPAVIGCGCDPTNHITGGTRERNRQARHCGGGRLRAACGPGGGRRCAPAIRARQGSACYGVAQCGGRGFHADLRSQRHRRQAARHGKRSMRTDARSPSSGHRAQSFPVTGSRVSGARSSRRTTLRRLIKPASFSCSLYSSRSMAALLVVGFGAEDVRAEGSGGYGAVRGALDGEAVVRRNSLPLRDSLRRDTADARHLRDAAAGLNGIGGKHAVK